MSADPTPTDVARMRHVVEEAEAYIAAIKEGDMVGCAALEAAVDRYVAAGRAAATPDGGEWQWGVADGDYFESHDTEQAARAALRDGFVLARRRDPRGPVEAAAGDDTETRR